MRRGRLAPLTLVLLGTLAGCARATTATVTPPGPPAAPHVRPAPAPAAPPASTALPAPPPPPAPPSPVVSPQLSQPEEDRLRRDATARIDSAERLVKQVADRKLGADQQETLSTIQSFLVKARQALVTQDLQQAFTLADKAEVLARDLMRTTH